MDEVVKKKKVAKKPVKVAVAKKKPVIKPEVKPVVDDVKKEPVGVKKKKIEEVKKEPEAKEIKEDKGAEGVKIAKEKEKKSLKLSFWKKEKKEEKEKKEPEKDEEEKGKSEGKEKKEKKSEKNEDGEKKNKKGLIAILIAILVLVGGGIAAKMILTKTSVTTETVKLPDDARGFSNYFKEYIVDRVEAEILFSNENENLGSEEILNKLSLLKDGFSKVSRGLASNYGKSEYKELATVMEADSNEYLSMIRETRAIVTGYSDENERKIAFIKKVEEMSEKLRSAIYITRAAFYQDVAGLSSKGAFAFNGGVMVEAGGGVMNIFLGNFEDNVVAISSDTMSEKVKEVEAGTLFGYTSSRVIKIGEALSKEIEGGWFKGVKAEVGNLEVKLTTAKVSLVMTSLNGVEEELKSLGIKGLVEDEEKPEIERLTEALGGLKGKK